MFSVCVCIRICTYKQKEPLSRNLQMNTQKIPEETGACALHTTYESTYMLMKVPFHRQTTRGDGENYYYFKIESFTSRPEVHPAFHFYLCVFMEIYYGQGRFSFSYNYYTLCNVIYLFP